MAFNPHEHIIQLKNKDYLETKWRIAWFRAEHPQGCIATEIVSFDPLLVKATIFNSENMVLATAHAGAVDKGNAVWSGRSVEKAETAAIGRALGHAGYGTQFAGDGNDDDEAESGHLADSPNERKRAAQQLGNGGERRAVQPETDGRSRETLAQIYSQVAVWFDDESEAGKKKHMMNVIAQLERNDLLNSTTPIPQVVEAIIANRREKTAQQTAQA